MSDRPRQYPIRDRQPEEVPQKAREAVPAGFRRLDRRQAEERHEVDDAKGVEAGKRGCGERNSESRQRRPFPAPRPGRQSDKRKAGEKGGAGDLLGKGNRDVQEAASGRRHLRIMSRERVQDGRQHPDRGNHERGQRGQRSGREEEGRTPATALSEEDEMGRAKEKRRRPRQRGEGGKRARKGEVPDGVARESCSEEPPGREEEEQREAIGARQQRTLVEKRGKRHGQGEQRTFLPGKAARAPKPGVEGQRRRPKREEREQPDADLAAQPERELVRKRPDVAKRQQSRLSPSQENGVRVAATEEETPHLDYVRLVKPWNQIRHALPPRSPLSGAGLCAPRANGRDGDGHDDDSRAQQRQATEPRRS